MKSLCYFGSFFFKVKIADILDSWWIKCFGKGLLYLKSGGIGVSCYWNYELSKLLLHFTEYGLGQFKNKHTKIALNSTIQFSNTISKRSFFAHLPKNHAPVKCLLNWPETII